MADQVSGYPQALPGHPAYLKVIMADGKGPLIGQSLGEFPHGLLILRTSEEGEMFIPWSQIWAVYPLKSPEAFTPAEEEP